MARPDRSPYDDEPRRPQGGLSLSTGRFAGRSAASSRSVSRSNSRSSGTRHNPLRDEYPSSRDRRREPAPDRRHSGTGRSSRAEGRRNDFDDRDRRRTRGSGSQGHSGARRSGRANHAADAFSPKMHTLAPQGMALGQFNIARMAMGVIVAFLVVVFAMALFHIGPFAGAPAKDGSKHVGVAGANAIGGNASNLAQNIASRVSLAQPVEPELAKLPAYSPTRDDLTNLAGQKAPFAFALGNAANESGEQPSAPVLSDRSLVSLNNALSYYDNNGYEASYLLLDLGTGRGIAGNLDSPIYGASSFKGPYCAYVAESYVDGGQLALSELSDDFFNIIVYSDNDTYDAMRARLPDSKLVLWLDSIGVDSDVAYDTWYPHYTARDSAKLWLATYNYLKGESAAAEVLERNFGRTDTSFMRTAMIEVEEAANAPADDGAADAQATFGGAVSAVLADAIEEARTLEVAVYDKAGWYPRDQDDVPAMVDAGIVECNGRDYLLCVLTNMPWSEPNQADAEALIAAVFEARADLG